MSFVVGSSLLAKAGETGLTAPTPVAPGPSRYPGSIIAAGGELMKLIGESSAADINSSIANYESEFAKRMAEIDVARVKDDANQKAGAAIANAGASEFAVDSPATQTAIDDIVRSGNLDAALIRMMGDIAEWRSETEQIAIEGALNQSYIAGATNIASIFVGGARPESIQIGAK